MDICGFTKTSTLDYPGKIAAVFFAPGCNFDCFYCHNRMLLENVAPLIDPGVIGDFLKKRQGMLDGVVLTGGEVTLQKDIADFAKSLKEMGYQVKLDTNGSRPEVVQNLLENKLLNYVALDFKAPWHRYKEICGQGANPQDVNKTLELVMAAKINFELRTTVIPQLSEEDLMQMAQETPKVPRFLLQQYREPVLFKPEDRFRVKQKTYAQLILAQMAEKMRAYQPGMAVR